MSIRLCSVIRRTGACELHLSRCFSSSEVEGLSPPYLLGGPPTRSAQDNYVSSPRFNDRPLREITRDLSSNVTRDIGRDAAFEGRDGQCSGEVRVRKPTQLELKDDIDVIFFYRNTFNEVQFMHFVKYGLQECNPSNIARFIRLSGKKSRHKSNAFFKAQLPAVASRIQALSSSSWRFVDISFVLYGLQSLDVKNAGYFDIISVMTKAGNATLNSKETLSAQGLSMMLYGLQKNKCEEEESLLLLKMITNTVPKCVEPFGAQAVGNALYGLQGMKSDRDEVRALVSSLVAKVDSCREPLSAQAVGNALYGLQGMSSDSDEVCALVSSLVGKVTKCKETLSAQNMGNALYGLQGMSSDSSEVCALISSLLAKVAGCNESLSAQNVGNALYGLRRMSSDSDEVLALVSSLVSKVDSCRESLSAQAVGNALYGLQGMRNDSDEVCALISSLVSKVDSCRESLSAQAVGNALYGLQSMNSDSSEVCALISSLEAKVDACQESLDAQAVGNALYGLQGMSSDRDEVRSLVFSLVPKVNGCKEALSAQAVGNALYGLRSMSSDSRAVRSLASSLASKVRGCKESLSGQELGNALYGLQGMSSDSSEVRALISSLVAKVDKCKESLSGQELGNALYGLQGMSSNSVEVCALISSLVAKVDGCEESFDAQNVGNALYGLICVLGSSSSLDIVNFLLLSLCNICDTTEQFKSLSPEDIVSLGQHVALSLPALQSSLSDENYSMWMILSDLIDDALADRPQSVGEEFQSSGEKRMFYLSFNALETSGVKISCNEHLFNLFESDIVLRIPRVEGDSLIMNIEVDGVHHLREKKKRFCMLRDKYFMSKGVIVERLDVSRMNKMKDEEIQTWLSQRIAAARLSSTADKPVKS